jgi:hypothetical protein
VDKDYQSWLDESCELARLWATSKDGDSAAARSRFFAHLPLQPLLMQAQMAEADAANRGSPHSELQNPKGPCH